jgi:hypothetical protein
MVQFTLMQLLLVTAIVAALASLAGAGHCEVAIFALLLAVFSLILWRLIRRKNQPRRYHKAAFELLLLAIVSSLILPTITRSTIWDGRATVSLMFVLTERETGNPIPGGRLEIGHIPTEPLNASALRVEAQATSDSQGQATINVTLPASGRDSLCKRTPCILFPGPLDARYGAQICLNGACALRIRGRRVRPPASTANRTDHHRIAANIKSVAGAAGEIGQGGGLEAPPLVMESIQ